jgi:thiol:disulfide interchange protein DsbD
LLGVFQIALVVAHAQEPVSWSVTTKTNRTLLPADKFVVHVRGQIASGWYIYSITQGPGGPSPTSISLGENQPFKLVGAVKGPPPRVMFDSNFGIDTEIHDDNVAFTLTVAVKAEAQAGTPQLRINVRFQVCNETTCLPPTTRKLTLPVTLASAVATLPAGLEPKEAQPTLTPLPSPSQSLSSADSTALDESSAPTPASEGGSISIDGKNSTSSNVAQRDGGEAVVFNTGISQNRSLWSFIWLAMTVGALSLLTPCVFPMVPITVSYFTNHAAANRKRALGDACVYAVGIILTFTALGVGLAILFGAAGMNKFASSPWINLLITAIFVSFALSLFGAFSVQVPSSVLTRLDVLTNMKSGAAGSGRRLIHLLLMGLTFSLTSFTCTAPFVGTLLVVASQGEWVYPAIGMLAFSTIFALPFFVLALAPQLISQLPKSGGWLNSVKVVMGLLEIAAAMKFLSNVDLVWHWGIFTREVVLASWVAVALLITVYLLGKFQLIHDTPPEGIGALRLLIALVSLSLSFYLVTGLFGRRLGELESFLPPATANLSSTTLASGGAVRFEKDELSWIVNDFEGALHQARSEGKLLFIDFTGYTCTNCRWMEANMFTKALVQQELGRYVRVRLYTDGEGEVYDKQQQMQQAKFGTVALPLYAVVNADGKALTTFPGLTRDEAEFISFLKTGQFLQISQARIEASALTRASY